MPPGETAREVIEVLSPQIQLIAGTVERLEEGQTRMQEDITSLRESRARDAQRMDDHERRIDDLEMGKKNPPPSPSSDFSVSAVWKRALIATLIGLVLGALIMSGLILMVGWDKIVALVK